MRSQTSKLVVNSSWSRLTAASNRAVMSYLSLRRAMETRESYEILALGSRNLQDSGIVNQHGVYVCKGSETHCVRPYMILKSSSKRNALSET